MSPDEYAHGVIRHILKMNASSHYWRGTRSFAVRVLDALFPRAIYVSATGNFVTRNTLTSIPQDVIARRMFHMEDLAKAMASARRLATQSANGEKGNDASDAV